MASAQGPRPPDYVIDRTHRPRMSRLTWLGWLTIFAAAYAVLGVLL